MPDGGIEVEKLYVSIESDIAKLLLQTREGVQKVQTELGGVENKGKQAFDNTGKAAEMSAVKFGLVTEVVRRLTDMLINLARQGVQALASLAQGAVGSNAQFETYAGQFTTLLGSAEAARARMAELEEFGIQTPFELPAIVEASRQLEVFGGRTLATGENLRMVGDIAAGVNRPFQEVAFWVGRMYDAIQNGQPFGEAAMRLQEMGALSGVTRSQMERLAKQGKDGSEIWQVFADQVGGKFAGNMERLSHTFTGVISNVNDFANRLLRIGGEPLFDEIRSSAEQLLAILQKNQPQLEEIAAAFGEVAASVADFLATGLINAIENLDYQGVMDMANALWGAVDSARTLAETLSGMDLGSLVEGVTTVADRLAEALETAAKLSAIVRAEQARQDAEWAELQRISAEKGVSATSRAAQAMSASPENQARIAGAGQAAYTQVMLDAAKALQAHEERVQEHTAALEENRAAATRAKDANQGLGDATRQQAAAFDKSSEAMDKLLEKSTDAMLDAVADRQQKVEELETEHGQKLAEIDQETADRRVELNQKLQDDLADLAEATALRRDELTGEASRQLADLEEESNRERQEKRREFNTSQRRAQEDFNREMIRLTRSYLDDVQDAVRSRDARAVVDLTKRFISERQERSQDFATRQSRERQDYARSVRESVDAEERRRAEIQDNLARQLRDLQDNEARKRRELVTAHARQLQELETSAARQRASEMSDYQKRRAALQQALATKLADVAKALADERSINASHAQQLLTALNKTFGAGGDIDQLMVDFEARRRQRLVVEVSLEAAQTPISSPGITWTNPYQPGGPLGGFAAGGSVLATRPTLALFGEAGPEVAHFIPLGKPAATPGGRMQIDLTVSGSAPPGIGRSEVNAIAGVLTKALKDAGVLAKVNSR